MSQSYWLTMEKTVVGKRLTRQSVKLPMSSSSRLVQFAARASSLAELSAECLLTQTQHLSNTQKPSLVCRNKSGLLWFYSPAFLWSSVPGIKGLLLRTQANPLSNLPPQPILSIPHRKKSAGKVICRNNVLIFLLAFQNTANFLSLVQLMESLGRSPTDT